MLVVTFKRMETCKLSLHVNDQFTIDAARVNKVQADCDELDVIIEQFPFLYNGKRVQTFTDDVAKMIMVFWQQKYN